MKKIWIVAGLLGLCAWLPMQASAEDLVLADEYERLIINWNHKGDDSIAALLAYPCKDCAPVRLLLTTDSELEDAEGQLQPVEMLKSKVEWEGSVQVMSAAPQRIVRIMLH